MDAADRNFGVDGLDSCAHGGRVEPRGFDHQRHNGGGAEPVECRFGFAVQAEFANVPDYTDDFRLGLLAVHDAEHEMTADWIPIRKEAACKRFVDKDAAGRRI